MYLEPHRGAEIEIAGQERQKNPKVLRKGTSIDAFLEQITSAAVVRAEAWYGALQAALYRQKDHLQEELPVSQLSILKPATS